MSLLGNSRGTAILDTKTVASYRWVHWGFGLGCIYGQPCKEERGQWGSIKSKQKQTIFENSSHWQNQSSRIKKAQFRWFCKINPSGNISGSSLWKPLAKFEMRQPLMNSLSFEKIPILSVFCKWGVGGMSVSPCFVVLRAQNRDISIFCPLLPFLYWNPFTPANYKHSFYFVCRKLRILIQFLKRIRFFFLSLTPLLVRKTSFSFRGESTPHSSLGSDPLFHVLLNTFESSQALTEANLNHLACILCVKPVKPGSSSIKHSLIWGVPWNQQGMCAGGRRKLNGSAVALLWPVQGILGQSLLGFEKRNRKTNGFYQFRWGVIHQPGAWIAVSDTGESQDVLLRKSQALLIFNQLTSWAELSNNLHWRFPKPDQIMVSIPT